jgi:hypothetical protein
LGGRNEYPWFTFWNKPRAAVFAETAARTPVIAWLDSDILIVREPTKLALGDEEDFAARMENFAPAVSAPGSPHEPYWRAITKVVGLDFEEIPWVSTDSDPPRIKLFWQAGVFAWRRETGLAREWLADVRRLLASRLASASMGFWLSEQIALALTMLRLKLRWRALDRPHNHPVNGNILHSPVVLDETSLKEARVLHYHDALTAAHWPRFLNRLREDRPDVHDWLASQGPLSSASGWRSDPLRFAVRLTRNLRYRLHQARCRSL